MAKEIVLSESRLQIACVRYFGYAYSDLRRLLFHVPNGRYRGAREATILKAEGVVPGVSDLILLVPRHGYHGLMVEVKTRTGKVRKTQKEWREAVEKQGYKYEIVRSLDEFMKLVNGYLC